MTGCAAQAGVFCVRRRSRVFLDTDGCAVVRRAARGLGGVCCSSQRAPAWLQSAVCLLSPLLLWSCDAGGEVKGRDVR